MAESKIPVLSFFTGGGFMDMGFELAGFEVKWTNEADPDFFNLQQEGITSWRKKMGFPIPKPQPGPKSIMHIKPSEIITEAFGDGIVPEIYGVIGGPPCQDFSMNGSRKGFEGQKGNLTYEYLKKINKLDPKPTFFVLENVMGLRTQEKMWNSFLVHLKKLQKHYIIETRDEFIKLNALEFGVPQNRQRIFITGILKSYLKKKKIKFSKNSPLLDFSKQKKHHKPLKYPWPKGMVINKGVPPKPEEEAYKIIEKLCVQNILTGKNDSTKNSKDVFQLKISEEKLTSIKEGDTSRSSFKKLHRYRYSPTACYGNNEVHLHPDGKRRLNLREVLRIQGVDDSYELTEGVLLTKKFKMAGNGVPVAMATGVANAIMEFLEQ